MNLEGGMDCLFEVKVEYPPRNPRWLKNPTPSGAKGQGRPPLVLPSQLKIKPIFQEKQFQDVIFRKTFEEILGMLMSIMAIFSTRSQLHYLNNFDPSAYISLVMIHIPIVDLSIY